MRIRLVSDLHLEFESSADWDFGSGDLLILAGDIVCARHLAGENPEASPYGSRYLKFIDFQAKNFDRVLMVMGNHESYQSNIDKDAGYIKRWLPENVQLLDDECVKIGDWTFVGGTLWTDMNNEHPLTHQIVGNGMNDFRVIRAGDGSQKFRTGNAVAKHRKTLQYFKIIADNVGKDGKMFVITHHSPHNNSVASVYAKEHDMNGGYRSDLSEFILDHPQIKYWVHGHMHNSSDYMIGDCRVMANPRGYPTGWGTYENKEHNPLWELAVK